MPTPTVGIRYDIEADNREFLAAMQRYKEQSGRMFPTWGEVLDVLQGLGYAKVARDPN